MTKIKNRNRNAAIRIQKVWRGHRIRKMYNAVLEKCRVLIEDDDDFDYSTGSLFSPLIVAINRMHFRNR